MGSFVRYCDLCVSLSTEPPSTSEMLETPVTEDWLEGRDWISCMAEIFSLYTHLESTSRKQSCMQRTPFPSVKQSKPESDVSSLSDIGLRTLQHVDVLSNLCKHVIVNGSSV